MKKHTTLKSKFNSAFSLVELLVVIAVIAVIAAIAIPNILGTTQSAEQATKFRNAQQTVSQWNNYVNDYYAASNAYPVTTAVPATVIGQLSSGLEVVTKLGTTNTYQLPGINTTNTALTNLAGQVIITNDGPMLILTNID